MKLQPSKFDLPLKVGLFLATFSWFTYVFYDLNVGIYSRHLNFPTVIEDLPGVWGLGFRMAAATTLIIILLLYVIRKETSRQEATMAFRFVLLFEAVYFAGFLGGAFNFWKRNYFTVIRAFEAGLPCFVLGFLLPIVLIKLFFELNPNKPKRSAIKWGLIYVTSFLFAFWFNNMGEWVGTVLAKGTYYIIQYPINMLSFVVTVVGLFLLFLYAANFTSKWLRVPRLENLDLKKILAVVTLLGIYPLFIFMLWLFFGVVGGWGTWYAWFLGHGYMSYIVLPITFITLPLLFSSSAHSEGSTPSASNRSMVKLHRKQLNVLVYLTQALGAIFFVAFTLAYYIPIPSTHFLIGTEPFFTILRIFGTLFFIFGLALTFLSFRTKIMDKSE